MSPPAAIAKTVHGCGSPADRASGWSRFRPTWTAPGVIGKQLSTPLERPVRDTDLRVLRSNVPSPLKEIS
ncbi:hypothetical protein GCM10023160_28670 [Brachybacterium paraconglomeratum]